MPGGTAFSKKTVRKNKDAGKYANQLVSKGFHLRAGTCTWSQLVPLSGTAGPPPRMRRDSRVPGRILGLAQGLQQGFRLVFTAQSPCSSHKKIELEIADMVHRRCCEGAELFCMHLPSCLKATPVPCGQVRGVPDGADRASGRPKPLGMMHAKGFDRSTVEQGAKLFAGGILCVALRTSMAGRAASVHARSFRMIWQLLQPYHECGDPPHPTQAHRA